MHWIGVVAPWIILYAPACLIAARSINNSRDVFDPVGLPGALMAGFVPLILLWAFMAAIKQVVM